MPATYGELKFGFQKRKRRGAYLKCKTCGELFYVTPARLRYTKKLGFSIQYCSIKCYDKTGDKNPFWGKKHSEESKIKMINNPNRPKFKFGIYNPNFVRWAEDKVSFKVIRKIKKYLKKNSNGCQLCGFNNKKILTIHHIDKNIKNNKKSNLLVLCPNCHSLKHALDRNHDVGIINSCGNNLVDKEIWKETW